MALQQPPSVFGSAYWTSSTLDSLERRTCVNLPTHGLTALNEPLSWAHTSAETFNEPQRPPYNLLELGTTEAFAVTDHVSAKQNKLWNRPQAFTKTWFRICGSSLPPVELRLADCTRQLVD